jgi:hypothetical protein
MDTWTHMDTWMIPFIISLLYRYLDVFIIHIQLYASWMYCTCAEYTSEYVRGLYFMTHGIFIYILMYVILYFSTVQYTDGRTRVDYFHNHIYFVFVSSPCYPNFRGELVYTLIRRGELVYDIETITSQPM